MKRIDIATACNIASGLVCYMNKEWSKQQLMQDLKRMNVPKEIVEHIQRIIPPEYAM